MHFDAEAPGSMRQSLDAAPLTRRRRGHSAGTRPTGLGKLSLNSTRTTDRDGARKNPGYCSQYFATYSISVSRTSSARRCRNSRRRSNKGLQTRM